MDAGHVIGHLLVAGPLLGQCRRFGDGLELLDQLLEAGPVAGPDVLWAYDQRIFGEYAQEARGVCLYRLGRYCEAAQAFTRALDIAPGNLTYRAKQQMALRRAKPTEDLARRLGRDPCNAHFP